MFVQTNIGARLMAYPKYSCRNQKWNHLKMTAATRESDWVSEWLNLMAFLETADGEVHIFHISCAIITYALESLSSLTQITQNLQVTINFNTLRPRRDRRHFADAIFKCIFLNENERISLRISLKFVPKGPINNNPALVQIMAWRLPGDKPLSESMLVRLPTHICVTRPQWVKKKKY